MLTTLTPATAQRPIARVRPLPAAICALAAATALIHLWHAWDDYPDSAKARADLPLVAQLHKTYQAQGLAVLGIGIHFEMPRLQKVIKEYHLTWPQICDGQDWRSALYRQLGAPKVPHTILIDRQGTIRAVGLHGDALKNTVAELVAAK